MNLFSPNATVVLTSTTSSQTTSVPGGNTTMIAYNAGSNPVYMRFAATVAVPDATWDYEPIYVVQPSTTQAFSIPSAGGTLAYIASTAGGTLVLSVGNGE